MRAAVAPVVDQVAVARVEAAPVRGGHPRQPQLPHPEHGQLRAVLHQACEHRVRHRGHRDQSEWRVRECEVLAVTGHSDTHFMAEAKLGAVEVRGAGNNNSLTFTGRLPGTGLSHPDSL